MFTLEHLIKGGIANNIKNVILNALITYCGLINYEYIVEHVVCLKVDGVFTI